jgi:ATP-dependent DNA helicase RecG
MKEQDGGMLMTLFRDVLTEDRLRKKGIGERQVKAIMYVKENRRISNSEYQKLFRVARNTASIELKKLVDAGFLKSSGAKGAGAFYTLP